MLAMLEHAVSENFLKRKHVDTLIVGDDPDELVARLMN